MSALAGRLTHKRLNLADSVLHLALSARSLCDSWSCLRRTAGGSCWAAAPWTQASSGATSLRLCLEGFLRQPPPQSGAFVIACKCSWPATTCTSVETSCCLKSSAYSRCRLPTQLASWFSTQCALCRRTGQHLRDQRPVLCAAATPLTSLALAPALSKASAAATQQAGSITAPLRLVGTQGWRHAAAGQLTSSAGSAEVPALLAATSQDGLLRVWDSAALTAGQVRHRHMLLNGMQQSAHEMLVQLASTAGSAQLPALLARQRRLLQRSAHLRAGVCV